MPPLPASNPLYPRSLFPNAVDVINDMATPAVSDAIGAVESFLGAGGAGVSFSGALASSSSMSPGGGTAPAPKLWGGTGAPVVGLGANGDFYFRADGAANTHIYFKSAGAWAGII